MTRRLISSGSRFESAAAYSRAVVDGDLVFVSGTTGFDYRTMTISDDVVEQCRKTFDNLEAALQQAGASLADVVRATYIVPVPSDFEQCFEVLRERLGEVLPAATMFAAPLIDARIKIEIEVTARLRSH